MMIDKSSAKPYYEQIVLLIKAQVLQGILQPGERIASVREMARQLLMNPNTVSKAYKMLEMQGVIMTVKGRGTYIAEQQATVRDDVKIAQIKHKIQDLVLEARYLSVDKTELTTWITEQYGRGQVNAND
ncbi:GntR family transcriptional regulator [Latilactobacillus graminis]|uniref:HTH gntR-type domain-containing protein n=2 Tax=Latilactobacillus graminis TaxID=60519 RepID=A0AA89HZS4_9LACO|nr:GntR family transcriptional regulator [Latilactobacillus graminis]KRM21098.1 hypothetical protein FC90_GL001635 [Latilactobacillus graminis DSM 20719]QFP79225.1 GntR family transcriptional regulator [Latilactobacillus graminis]